MLPPEAILTYIRLSCPPAQRTPSPNTCPAAITALPCSTMLDATGVSPCVVNTRLSVERFVNPLGVTNAPPVAEELSQPRPVPTGGFEHGQVTTPAIPGSHGLMKLVPRSRTNASHVPFRSLGIRLLAKLSYVMNRPSAEIDGTSLSPLPSMPFESTLILSVIRVSRSRRKMSSAQLLSFGTRSSA